MKTAVIFGAAPIKNYETVKKYISDDDFFIFCDGGLVHQKALDIAPDLIIGDFDSFELSDLSEKVRKNTEIIKLPCEKDDTDVFFVIEFWTDKILDCKAAHSESNFAFLASKSAISLSRRFTLF